MNPLPSLRHEPHRIDIALSAAARRLFGPIALLALAGIAAVISTYLVGRDNIYGLVPEFSLDQENNVPTWLSSVLLLTAAVWLAVIATLASRENDRWTRHWACLAAIFVFLSIDETSSIHEHISHALHGLSRYSRALTYAWVLPFGLAAAAIGVAYLRFAVNLPGATRRRTFAGGIVYIVGAIGFEVLEGLYKQAYGVNFAYGLLTVVEETLEMAGVAIFIHGLLLYVALRWGAVTLELSSSRRATANVAESGSPQPPPAIISRIA